MKKKRWNRKGQVDVLPSDKVSERPDKYDPVKELEQLRQTVAPVKPKKNIALIVYIVLTVIVVLIACAFFIYTYVFKGEINIWSNESILPEKNDNPNTIVKLVDEAKNGTDLMATNNSNVKSVNSTTPPLIVDDNSTEVNNNSVVNNTIVVENSTIVNNSTGNVSG